MDVFENAADSEIRNELEPSEHLLWSGMPRQGVHRGPQEVFLLPLCIAWCAFAILFEVAALLSKEPMPLALVGLPFVAIGLYLAVGRFLLDARARARTWYGLTDRRVLILRGAPRRLTSIPLEDLPGVEIHEKDDGSGFVRFGPPMTIPPGPAGAILFSMVRSKLPGFDLEQDARRVHALVLKARDARK